MRRMRVIGIGSLIMTDDGIGTRIAEALRGRLEAHGISVLIGETDVHYCLGEIQPDDILIIIDSMIRGKEPGSIAIIPLQGACESRSGLHSQHDYSLIDALPFSFPNIQGHLIGIEALEIGLGYELSKALRDRFDQICDDVLNAILKMREAANVHDTHLIEKIYGSIAEICRQNSIVKVVDLHIEVNEGSHITETLLLEHLCDRDTSLFGSWTDVHVDYQPLQRLTAVIISIDGDTSHDQI